MSNDYHLRTKPMTASEKKQAMAMLRGNKPQKAKLYRLLYNGERVWECPNPVAYGIAKSVENKLVSWGTHERGGFRIVKST